ncbi:hypothetical protein KK083_17895 [Fulvivirgaceae bacterium PWU4]|uniref:Uncharacterized protein n=1 Tax=Chryseosolibacter histidini TaxID=2782349 RepID=A0AAP2GQB2_9BACT|nr:hypothetical protein [Chryseosolibacter histidini]MBT1698770.1 hypothetical protein [Chryseosolibacter histidini]
MGTPDEIPHEFEELVILFLEKRITDEQISSLEEWLEKDDIYLYYFDEINTIYQLGIVQRLNPEKMKQVWEKVVKKLKG